jgi:hypothetical protein
MKLPVLFFCLLFSCEMNAQTKHETYVPADKVLFETIRTQDSLLFHAFNTRDLTKLKTLFATDLEVYQDNVGLRNYEQTITAFTELFKKDYVLIRTLNAGSLEVYPVKDYGAIETGSHSFCHVENGKQECGTFKFLHIWQQQNGLWKLKKIITYDH